MIYLILVVGLILRLINLNQSLWLDEAISAIAARDYSFLGIIKDFIPGDTHPPLYYLVLRVWSLVFGYSEISLRMPSVIFGVLTIYFVYKISKLFINHKSYIIYLPALLLTTSGLHIYYSHEVRMYALSTFLVSLVVYFFLKSEWIKFSLSLALLGMTDYLPLLVIPVFWIYSTISKKTKVWWKKFYVSHIPLAIFLIFWLPTFIQQSMGSRIALISFPAWGELLGKAPLKELALVWVKFIIGRISFEPPILYALIVLVVSTSFLFLLFQSLKKLKKLEMIWMWFIIPIIFAFLGSFFVPGFSYFRLIFVLPAFYILLSNNKYLSLILVTLNLFFSFVYISNQEFWREDWRRAISFVEAQALPNEIAIMAFPEPFASWRWYSTGRVSAYGVIDSLSQNSEKTRENVINTIQDRNGVYYFIYLSELTDPQEVSETGLSDSGFTKTKTYDFRGVGFVEYWKGME